MTSQSCTSTYIANHQEATRAAIGGGGIIIVIIIGLRSVSASEDVIGDPKYFWIYFGRKERREGRCQPPPKFCFPQKIHLVPIFAVFMALLFANMEQLFFDSWKYFEVWYAALFWCTDRLVLRGLGAAFSPS